MFRDVRFWVMAGFLLHWAMITSVMAEVEWSPWATMRNYPVPENARVTLSTDKEEFFLGENVLVHYTMENTGGPSFPANFGGDYRGAQRELRFKVSGVDEQGTPLEDPYPNSPYMGGFMSGREITPDRPYYKSLSISHYLRFEEPGTYRIRVHHDCGWKATEERPYPSAELKLTFKRPTPEQAKELVETWLKEPKFQGVSFGEKTPPHADFSVIRAPEYLPALTEAARAGDKRGIIGLGSIPTPEATRILLELLQTLEEEPKQLVSREFRSRLPNPALTGELDKRNPFENQQKSYRLWLVSNSWDETFVPETRALASRLLEDEDSKWVATGAYLLECVGTTDDTARLIAALDREIPKTKSRLAETHVFPRPRGACEELQRAARMMHHRGAEIPTQPASPGEAILFLLAISLDETFRPADWIESCGELLNSDIPYLREQTLKYVPAPFPTELHSRLPKLVRSPAPDVSREACRVVGRDKLTAFTQPVLKTLRRAKEDWHFRAASQAALELGAEYDRLTILVDRLDEPEMLFKCLDGLKTIFDNTGGGGFSSNFDQVAEGRRIKPMWKALIVKHTDHLQSGGKLSLPHPDVTSEMVPETYSITLKTGETWPERK